MLYKSELKKIFGNRFFVIVLIAMLLANGVLAYRAVPDSGKIPAQDIQAFVEYYLENPEEIEQYRIDREIAKNNFFDSEEFLEDVELSDAVPDVYSTSDAYNDDDLLRALTAVLDIKDGVEDDISRVIANGENNKRLLKKKGIKEGDFLYVYQQKAIDTYNAIKEPVINSIKTEHIYGWEAWLNYNTGTLLMLIVLILLGSSVFGVEGRCGTLELIRTLKRGRRDTAFAKCTASLTVSASIGIMFCLTSLLGVGIKGGYSSPANAIQAVSGYELVPIRADIWQYALIHIAGVILAAIVFCTFSTLVAALFRGAAVALAGGALFAALNLLLWKYSYKTTNNPLQYLNLFAAADGDALFSYVHGMSFFGIFVHCWIFLILLSALLCILFTLAAVFCFDRFGTKDLRIRCFRNIVARIKSAFEGSAARIKSNHRLRNRSLSLIGTESSKLLLNRGFVLILILLLALKLSYTDEHYKDIFEKDEIYYNYIDNIKGEWTEEKHEKIYTERSKVKETIYLYDTMQNRYNEGSITRKEFNEYLYEYSYAVRIEIPLEAIYNTSLHLKELSSRGITGSFVYDTGWKRLYNREYDTYLYLIIILIGSFCFNTEYNATTSGGGFHQILRSTKRGRANTFRAKFALSCCSALIASMLCASLDLYFVLKLWELPDASVPLISLSQYANAPAQLTLLQYAIFVYAAELLSMLLLGVLTFALSCLFGRAVNCLIVTAAITLIPHLIGKTGLSLPLWCDYFGLQQVDQLAKWSMDKDLLAPFGGYALVASLWIAATIVLILAASRKWIEKRR